MTTTEAVDLIDAMRALEKAIQKNTEAIERSRRERDSHRRRETAMRKDVAR